MGIFIALYCGFILIYLVSLSITNEKQKRIFSCITCFLILWIVQALRSSSIGTDVGRAYKLVFESVSTDFNSLFILTHRASFEPGYEIYEQIIKIFISSNINVFLGITSALILLPISYIIYKYSKNCILSFIIFSGLIIYHFSFSGLRQSLAIGIIFFSLKYIIEQKPIKFITCVLLAASFHTSAIIFLAMYPIRNFNLTGIRSFIIFLIWIPCIFALKNIAIYLSAAIFGAEKYASYFSQGNAYNLMILFFVIYILAVNLKSTDKTYLIYKQAALFALLAQSFGLISDGATRIGYYFIIFMILLIPYMINNYLKNPTTRNMISFSVAILSAAFFFYIAGGGYLEVIPYKFFWEN